MLTVQVLINGQVIFARSCRNIAGPGPEGHCIYHADDGVQIEHRRQDGAVVLARKLLDYVEEP